MSMAEESEEIVSNSDNNGVRFWSEWYERADGKEPWTTPSVNPFLIKHKEKLLRKNAKKVFVPLCGRAPEIKWFHDLGLEVVGVEGSELQVIKFFTSYNMPYTTEKQQSFILYKSSDGNIRIYVGDFFTFSSSIESNFDAVWDRGAYIAIHRELRPKYCKVMMQEGLLNKSCRWLLDVFQYDTSKFTGPPESITVDDLELVVRESFTIEKLEEYPIEVTLTDNGREHFIKKFGNDPAKYISSTLLMLSKNGFK